MLYEVMLTSCARKHIKEIIKYISKTLLEPQIARKWSDTLKREFKKLNYMPLRYPLVLEEPWRAKGIHRMLVKNYLVYYFVDKEKQIVWITGVVYAHRNQIEALLSMPLDEIE